MRGRKSAMPSSFAELKEKMEEEGIGEFEAGVYGRLKRDDELVRWPHFCVNEVEETESH